MTTPNYPSCDDPRTRVPRAYVDKPDPGQPVLHGLFSAATVRENVSRHELNGIEYEPVCHTEVWEWPHFCASYGLGGDNPDDVGRPDPRCNPAPIAGRWKTRDEDPTTGGFENPNFRGEGDHPPPYALKRLDNTKGWTPADPFTVYAGEQCFTGNHDNTIAVRNLRERFRLGEQEAVERVVYNGFLPDPERPDWAGGDYADPAKPFLTPSLRWDPVILNNAQPTPLVHAVGMLEHWLQATSGARGVIHAPAYMASALGGGDIVTSSGPRAVSRLGHMFVFGTGYSGRKPLLSTGDPVPNDGDPNAWLYATRPVTVRRSTLIEPADWESGAVNLRTNHGSMVIERIYTVDWPCAHAAIRTDYPLYDLAEGIAPPASAHETTARIQEVRR